MKLIFEIDDEEWSRFMKVAGREIATRDDEAALARQVLSTIRSTVVGNTRLFVHLVAIEATQENSLIHKGE